MEYIIIVMRIEKGLLQLQRPNICLSKSGTVICDRTYTLSAKWNHIKTKKHQSKLKNQIFVITYTSVDGFNF